MLRKIYAITITSLLLLLSMSVSVFAWYTYAHYDGSSNGLGGKTPELQPIPVGDRELIDIFEGQDLEYLTYITKGDFNTNADYLLGYASVAKITLENTNPQDVHVNLQLQNIVVPEYGYLSGSVNSLKYLVLEEGQVLNDVYQLVQNTNNNNTFYDNIRTYNIAKKISMSAGSVENPFHKDVYVYIWGDFTGLSEAQKPYMQSVAYRIKLALNLV